MCSEPEKSVKRQDIGWRVLFLVSLFINLGLFAWLIQVREAPTVTQPDKPGIAVDSVFFGDTLCGNRYMQLSVLFQQRAAEYRALSYQGFNLALIALKEDLKDKSINKPRAIITDIDETILDNSPYQAECILRGISYPEGWDEWCLRADARAIPGALEFCQLAVKYGLDIFYITNRKEHLREATLKNLAALGFPVKDEDHLMMRTSGSEKITRRETVAQRFHISLLLGDNLNDFNDRYYRTDESRRMFLTDSLSREFGRKYIVLPNPMYGDWESVLYEEMNEPDLVSRMKVRDSMLIVPGKHL